MALPPSAGAVHATVAEAFPATDVTPVGAAGAVGTAGVIAADGAELAPVPTVFVVKKNAKVLENLNGWISRLPGPAKAAPVLVIDDESDQASTTKVYAVPLVNPVMFSVVAGGLPVTVRVGCAVVPM